MRQIALITLVALSAGCATTPKPLVSTGRLVSLDDGTLTTLQMEFSQSGGTMTGTNPKTGEKFTGEYTATMDRAVGSVPGATVSAANLKASGAGVLVGDKGSVLDCQLDINAGYFSAPTGVGTCTDQRGRRYRLQF